MIGNVPGSLLDIGSVTAAPDEFVISRWQDAWASLTDPEALILHGRVIRWTLDEFAPPAQLFAEIIQLLYQEDRFARDELYLSGRPAGAAALQQLPLRQLSTARADWSRPLPLSIPCIRLPSLNIAQKLEWRYSMSVRLKEEETTEKSGQSWCDGCKVLKIKFLLQMDMSLT